jgi:hypothetical protein
MTYVISLNTINRVQCDRPLTTSRHRWGFMLEREGHFRTGFGEDNFGMPFLP